MKDWLAVLDSECKRRTQRAVADDLGVSPAMINTCLKGTYTGNVARLKRLVEGRYMRKTVICPVLGEIATDKCLWHQEREFAATNPQRILLYRACRSGCENAKANYVDGELIPVVNVTAPYDVEYEIRHIETTANGDKAAEIEMLRNELRQQTRRIEATK